MIKKILILVIGIIIAITISVALYIFRTTDKNGVRHKPNFVIPADSLVALYDVNEDSANVRFLDKVIEVKGSVAEISHDSVSCVVLLRDSSSTEGVSCSLGVDQFEKTHLIKNGTIIRVKGICAGKLIYISLNKCTILGKY